MEKSLIPLGNAQSVQKVYIAASHIQKLITIMEVPSHEKYAGNSVVHWPTRCVAQWSLMRDTRHGEILVHTEL